MDYKDTLNLPKTPFPMKGNLPVKEKEILKYWDDIKLYEKLRRAKRKAPRLSFMTAPPMQTAISTWEPR